MGAADGGEVRSCTCGVGQEGEGNSGLAAAVQLSCGQIAGIRAVVSPTAVNF